MGIESEAHSPETSELIELFTLDLTSLGDNVYYFVRGLGASSGVVWQGNTYVAVDFETDGFELNGRGEAPTPTVRFSVTNQLITGLINDLNDLIGAKITRTKTYRKFLDTETTANPNAHFPLDIFRVERKVRENRFMVEFELSSVLDQQGRELPARTITSNYCPWVYRRFNGGSTNNPLLDFDYHEADNKCPYVGSGYYDTEDNPTTKANDKCGKRVSSCKLRFGKDAELPYGGFPGASRPLIG